MSRTLAETYYLKAQDAYPLNLAGTFEALNYALSYDDEHIQSNLMMAEIQVDYMNNPVAAEEYYHAALSAGTDNFDVFKNYSQFLFDQGRLEEAEKVNEYAAKLQGVDLSCVIRMRGLIAEKRFAYRKAKRLLESAFCHTYNDDYYSLLRMDIKRVKHKILFYKNQKKRIKNEK